MAHPLDGCWLKLDRADVHFDALKVRIERLYSSEPDRIRCEFDAQRGQYVGRVDRDIPAPPADLSPVVGDVVHNLYCALDSLACELVIANRQAIRTRTAFLIFEDPARYVAEAPQKIRGIDPGAEAIIKKLQPCHRSDFPEEDPLALLYSLEQRDKHRTLNLTINHASALFGDDINGIDTQLGSFTVPIGPRKRGAVIATYTPGINDPQVQVYFDVTHHVAFDEGGPAGGMQVLETLDEIRRHVRSIPSMFLRFF